VHQETDFVRIEVEAALKRKIPVIPALVSGATMPKPAELPDELRGFAFRNGTAIDSGVNFRNDINRLIRSLDETFATRKSTAGAPATAPEAPARRFEQHPRSADSPPSDTAAPTRSRIKRILWRILKPIALDPADSMFIKLLKRCALVGIAVLYSWLLVIGLVVILASLHVIK
jgi:hypothetical protein